MRSHPQASTRCEEHEEHADPDDIEEMPLERGIADRQIAVFGVVAGVAPVERPEECDQAADAVERVGEDEEEDQPVEIESGLFGLMMGAQQEEHRGNLHKHKPE